VAGSPLQCCEHEWSWKRQLPAITARPGCSQKVQGLIRRNIVRIFNESGNVSQRLEAPQIGSNGICAFHWSFLGICCPYGSVGG
jgi:hypothetical protein